MLSRTIKWALLVIFVLLAGCVTTPVKQLPRWQLVYTHDKQGQPLFGDKQNLVRLIESGHPVRIFWPIRDNFTHSLDAGFLTVVNGEVFAQPVGIIRQNPQRPDYKSILLDAKEQTRWHAILSTTGELNSFNSAKDVVSIHQVKLSWYVYH